jgi:hypothetical protein
MPAGMFTDDVHATPLRRAFDDRFEQVVSEPDAPA